MQIKKALFTLLTLFTLTTGNAQNYNPVINYYFNGTPEHGIKIKTNLPFVNSVGMPTIIIEGFEYNNGKPIGLTLTWYIYYDAFFRANVSSWGAYTPEILLGEENGLVVFS